MRNGHITSLLMRVIPFNGKRHHQLVILNWFVDIIIQGDGGKLN